MWRLLEERAIPREVIVSIGNFVKMGPLSDVELIGLAAATRCIPSNIPTTPKEIEALDADNHVEVMRQMLESQAATAACFLQIRESEDAIADAVVTKSMLQKCGKRPVLSAKDVVRMAVSSMRRDQVPDQALDGCMWNPGARDWFPCGQEAARREKNQSKSRVPLHRWYSRALFRVIKLGVRAPSAPMFASTYILELVHDGENSVSPPVRITNKGKGRRFPREELLYVGNEVVIRQGSIGEAERVRERAL